MFKEGCRRSQAFDLSWKLGIQRRGVAAAPPILGENEKVYRNLQALGEGKFKDTKLVQKNVAIINDKLEWFTKAEARFQNVAFQPFQVYDFINQNSLFQ